MSASFEERVDEMLALASHAGMLGAEAATAEKAAYASRDPHVKRHAREARRAATVAEQALASARRRFLFGFGGRS